MSLWAENQVGLAARVSDFISTQGAPGMSIPSKTQKIENDGKRGADSSPSGGPSNLSKSDVNWIKEVSAGAAQASSAFVIEKCGQRMAAIEESVLVVDQRVSATEEEVAKLKGSNDAMATALQEDRDKLTDFEAKFEERMKSFEERLGKAEAAGSSEEQIHELVKNEFKNVQSNAPSASSTTAGWQARVPAKVVWKVGNLGWDLTEAQLVSRTQEVLTLCGIESKPSEIKAEGRVCLVEWEDPNTGITFKHRLEERKIVKPDFIEGVKEIGRALRGNGEVFCSRKPTEERAARNRQLGRAADILFEVEADFARLSSGEKQEVDINWSLRQVRVKSTRLTLAYQSENSMILTDEAKARYSQVALSGEMVAAALNAAGSSR